VLPLDFPELLADNIINRKGGYMRNLILKLVFVIWVFMLGFTLGAKKGECSEIETEQAMKCLLGEARSEGIEGMTAVGEVLRRSPKVPFYGAKNIRNKGERWYALEKGKWRQLPSQLVEKAKKAWIASENSNLTNGATNFESVDFEVPYWAKEMREVARVKKHIFYKKEV